MVGKFLDKTLLVAVIGYIVYNVYTFYEMFSPSTCIDTKACVFPAYPGNEILIIEGCFSKGNGCISSHKFAIPPFNSHQGVKWTGEVEVPTTIFENGTATCNFQVRTHKNYNLFTGDIMITTHREPSPKSRNLLSPQKSSVSGTFKPTTHWLSHLEVYILKDTVAFPVNAVPHELMPYFHVFRKKSELLYLPLFLIDPQLQPTYYWLELPENPTKSLNFTIEVIPLSIGRFRLRCMLAQAAKQLKVMGIKDKDIDDIQGIFTETNLYLLLTTVVVSVFHLFFDFLAFKNDVQFWRNAENTTGISIRTIVWRCISTSIIFLYLYEEKSSLLVIVPSGISMVIEFWKLCRMTKVSFSLRGGVFVGQRSKEEQETDELDAYFVWRLMYFMVPLCVIGAVYSLLYMPHRSWRSWILQTAVNGVYAFGFLLMTPQLFINYKLKSVANLPWRALTYKAFNTFIDDFFAFIIKMPTAHRVACFRDDVVFVIYMYQRWLYPVDHTRVSEFGQLDAEKGCERNVGTSSLKKLKTA
ncbi:cleft lip and palate transmembrane protein [Echinococcus multilocularis]|uniref:Lipid scramblase CLPTM1L n=1 Tax=Echinococcus multilocularis TaxID=6211 RepID=A0A068Y7K3_ECHMU|nr:cleft lip and palate transmembrane protein [Echinococcus multilocularis]